ncbi:MAG: pyridoxal phosphate-dependent aminotransferase [Endomicrobium sp.]|jgi:cystathionine beta-lyase|nr:pyridoxal phosphate-dependent aminotransferase [Endomicrobium sp.]
MKYNFDKIIDRKNTNSLKYDFPAEQGYPPDCLPLWVADMDFQTPPEVRKVLEKSARHGIFGYTSPKKDYFDAVQSWFLKRFGFKSKSEWIVTAPGIVFSIATAIKAFTSAKNSVLIQTPVYYPFHSCVKINNRKLVKNSLVFRNGKYIIDFKDFEKKIIDNKVKLFLLCSPHNPVGRVWTKNELIKMGKICLKHNVIVVSDEIHCDFIFKGNKHTVFGTLGEKFLNNSIICTAPSKTFNLAGLQVSNIFIADKEKRRKFELEIQKTGYSQLNTMGIASCQNAYENGVRWVDELNEYLQNNLEYIRTFIKENIPKIKLIEPEGTYLLWLDFDGLQITENKLKRLVAQEAKLHLSYGKGFGIEGKGFFRVNAACPLSTIKKAFNRLKNAVNSFS